MRRLSTIICLFAMGLLCMAKEITIIPKFAVGDTLKYRTTAQVIMHHGKDSLVSLTKLLPRLIVESRNDKGFIIRTTNSLESFDITCTDPESEGLLPDKTDELNDFVASVKLRIQLDAVGRPDSILNIDEVKETMLEAYIKMFKKEQGINIENSDEWEIDTKPFLVSAVDMICAPKHLIEQQFGNLPYFNLLGIPLKPGKIPASMILTDELQAMLPEIEELKMDVRQLVNTTELNLSKEDGFYVIRVKGKKRKTEVEGELLYAGGILNHGYLSVKQESDADKLITNFIIDAIK